MHVAFPLEVFLHIFPYLNISDIHSLRSTCKAFLEMTKSRSVWSVLYQTYILDEDIPTPGFNGHRSLEFLSAIELESATKRAVRLRKNWNCSKPNPSRRAELTPMQDVPMRVIRLNFVPGHSARWLISLHAANIGGTTSFIVRNWDLACDPPRQADSLTFQQFTGLLVNTIPGHPYTLAVQCSQLEMYSIDVSNGGTFKHEHTMPGRRWRLLTFTGSTLVSRSHDDGDLIILNVDSPLVEARLSNPDHLQLEECHDAIIHDKFILVLRITSIELYDLSQFRNASPDGLQPVLRLEPAAQHKWPWKIDSGSMVHQVSSLSIQQKTVPPIYVLARFGSWFPWPVNILHHFRLSPNLVYDDTLAIGPDNLPYQFPPSTVQTIASPVRLFSTTDMVLGTYGTAVWIDTHTEEYFNPDCGQRLAGYSLNTMGAEEGMDIPQTTMASVTFDLNQRDTWVRLAMDEAEGRVVAGHSTGEITVYDYA